MKKSVILSAAVGTLLVAAVIFAPVVKAQTPSIEETLVTLTQQVIALVSAINDNVTQQFSLQDTRISALESRVYALEHAPAPESHNVGSVEQANPATPFATLSTADQDAITEMVRNLPEGLATECRVSTSGKNTQSAIAWADRRSYDRIFRLACTQIGL